MAKRDRESEDDIRNYLPDLATIMKRADPAFSDKIYREAMDNPELDEALEERRKLLADRSSDQGPELIPSAAAAPNGVAGADAQGVRVSAPSPWAKAATGDTIDKSALPSASAPKAEAPAAVPPVTSPVRPTQRRRTLPMWVFPAVLAIALSPLAMWAVVSVLPPRHPLSVPASAAPSEQASGPAPSVAPTTSAAAPPAALSADRAPLSASTVDAGAVAPPASQAPERSPRTPVKLPKTPQAPVAPTSATTTPTDPPPPPPPKMIN